MPQGMALDTYGNRQASYVGGKSFHMCRQGGNPAAETLRSYAQVIYLHEYIRFQFRRFGIAAGFSQVSQQGFF
jgi:hypothetical protein